MHDCQRSSHRFFCVDLGIGVFVDDAAKVHVDAYGADAANLERNIHLASQELTDRLAQKGYAQNAAKQVSLVQFRGKGRSQATRTIIFKNSNEELGCIRQSDRFLGPHVNLQGQIGEGIARRIKAAKVAWSSVTLNVWRSALPKKAKCSLLNCVCLGSFIFRDHCFLLGARAV